MLVVLITAALHASWNAIIKAGSEKFADIFNTTWRARFPKPKIEANPFSPSLSFDLELL
jgi:hypothetical protein